MPLVHKEYKSVKHPRQHGSHEARSAHFSKSVICHEYCDDLQRRSTMKDEQHDQRERHQERFEVKVIGRGRGQGAEKGTSVYALKREEYGDQEAQIGYVGAERTILGVAVVLSREASELSFAPEAERTHYCSSAYPPGCKPVLVKRVIGMFG